MAISVFADKARPPSEADVHLALGPAAPLWSELIDRVGALTAVGQEWGFTSKSTGWGLRLRSGERVIVYMTPCGGHFLSSFALGAKPMAALRNGNLQDHVLEVLAGAKKYAEGYGVRIAVRTPEDVADVVEIARAKLAG